MCLGFMIQVKPNLNTTLSDGYGYHVTHWSYVYDIFYTHVTDRTVVGGSLNFDTRLGFLLDSCGPLKTNSVVAFVFWEENGFYTHKAVHRQNLDEPSVTPP
jgi:hypothetical protein